MKNIVEQFMANYFCVSYLSSLLKSHSNIISREKSLTAKESNTIEHLTGELSAPTIKVQNLRKVIESLRLHGTLVDHTNPGVSKTDSTQGAGVASNIWQT